MPEAMAEDLIVSFSRPGELVLDPFSGEGTTAKMALLNHRDYLGFEIWPKAYQLSVKRLARAHAVHQQRLDQYLLSA